MLTPINVPPAVWVRRAVPLAAGLALAACVSRESPLSGAVRIPSQARDAMAEASGVVVSVTQPGVFFTINDSGHDPVVFALDLTGADRGAWRVAGATNDDWEAASGGWCRAGDPTSGRCLYLGDVGDNGAVYPTRAIYRVPEPGATGPDSTGVLPSDRVEFRYDQGPRDVEAMYVGPGGATHLITKRPLAAPDGRLRPALVFTLPAEAWHQPDSVAVAVVTDSLPIVPGSANGRLITGAALSPDGRALAVRTYTEVYVFATDSASGRVRHDVAPAVCDVRGLRERQGEAVAWTDPAGDLLLVSEGVREPFHVIRCPPPAP